MGTIISFIASVVLVMAVVTSANAQSYKLYSKTIPSFVFGTWKIYRYKSNGGTMHKPEDYVGKQITFKRKSMSCDKDFLFLDYPCRLKRYEFEDYRPDPHEVNKGIMLWGSDDGLPNREKVFKACWDRRAGYCYYFEIDKRNELMIYYDGWMYFLQKVKKSQMRAEEVLKTS